MRGHRDTGSFGTQRNHLWAALIIGLVHEIAEEGLSVIVARLAGFREIGVADNESLHGGSHASCGHVGSRVSDGFMNGTGSAPRQYRVIWCGKTNRERLVGPRTAVNARNLGMEESSMARLVGSSQVVEQGQ